MPRNSLGEVLVARRCRHCDKTGGVTAYAIAIPGDVPGRMRSTWLHPRCVNPYRAALAVVRLPWGFYVDHRDRALATPAAVKQTTRNVWVRRNDPALVELIDDARHYADRDAQDHDFGARALLRAVRRDAPELLD